jgi:hypothetical protein
VRDDDLAGAGAGASAFAGDESADESRAVEREIQIAGAFDPDGCHPLDGADPGGEIPGDLPR